MENFEVKLAEKKYKVEPQDNGTFRIFENEQKIGVVYPEPGDLVIEWKTMDELEPDFVAQLGQVISEHQTTG